MSGHGRMGEAQPEKVKNARDIKTRVKRGKTTLRDSLPTPAGQSYSLFSQGDQSAFPAQLQLPWLLNVPCHHTHGRGRATAGLSFHASTFATGVMEGHSPLAAKHTRWNQNRRKHMHFEADRNSLRM